MIKISKLKITILKEGVTQKELARRTNLDASLISLICNCRYVPTSAQRQRIAKALNKSEEELFDK